MKQKLIAIIFTTLFFAACNNEKAEDVKKDNASTDAAVTDASNNIPALSMDSAGMAEMTKAWMDYATPGAEHAWMAKHTGTWVCDSVKQWMDPSQPPSTNKATETVTMDMNGLYQMTSFSGSTMGQPLKGHSMMGYDKMKKKFVLSWIDNMGSGIVRMEGTYDEASKTLSMAGKQSDPGRKMETDIRQTLKFNDDNSYTLSMYGTGHDGKTEQKFMEGTFKRKR
jgi:hypothetical protein